MWSHARVLLVIPPMLPVSVYVFMAAPESNAEIETLVRSWGHDEIELLPDGSMRVGASRLQMWDAQVVNIPAAKAVVIREDGTVTAVALCRDINSAEILIRSFIGGPRSGEIVRLEAMPAGDPHRRRLRWRVVGDATPPATRGLAVEGFRPFADRRPAIEARLVEIAKAMADAGIMHAPSAELSAQICSHCGDHPLYADPTLDGTDPDGRRLCVACARLAMILPYRQSGGSQPEERA